MPTSLFQYEMLPTTWTYLSALMIIATFFRFNRFWSIRNLDILGLIALSPGLLYIAMGKDYTGYLWLHVVGLLIFARLLLDVFLVRRPLLEPNLASPGLIFSSIMLIAFLIPNLLINRGESIESYRTLRLEQILTLKTDEARKKIPDHGITDIPGYRPFYLLADRVNRIFLPPEKVRREVMSEATLFPEALVPSLSEMPDRLDSVFLLPEEQEIFLPRMASESTRAEFSQGEVADKIGSLAKEESGLPAKDQVGGEGQATSPGAEVTLADAATGSVVAEKAKTAPDVRSVNILLDQERAAKTQGQESEVDQVFLTLLAIFAQFGIVFGLIVIGHCHFGNLKTGLAAAMVYLLLPYVNQMTGSVTHSLPGMLLVLAVAIYRRPFFSGFFIGLAGSFVFYPFCLLPLWISFYWRRGAQRFIIGALSAVLLTGLLLLFSPSELGSFGSQLAGMFGWRSMFVPEPGGIWAFIPTYYRIPIIALFFVVTFGLAIWPTRKNFATLISCSTLLLLGVQFWQGYNGGLYMGWYLPLLILTLFRPNLEDRVATATVVEI